ncbi:MAG TPA: bifunctional nuclease family protein [Methanoregulaceae archaeon]|nr:bifunctional nuclease family protein [Methanoregulaceae archaeon]
MDQVPCEVKGVFVAVSAGSPVPVVILDAGDDACIPIFIGLWEAISINNALNNEIPPRPLTHDLFIDFLDRYNITLQALTIDTLDEGVFYAKMVLVHEDREELLDCRPSDGIAIAIRCKAGIYLDQSVIRSSSVRPGDLPDFIGLNSYLYD